MNKKNIKGIIIISAICLFLEVFVFNINSFRLIGKKYQYKNIEISDEILNDFVKVDENKYEVVGNNPKIILNDLNMETGTIRLDAKRENFEEDIYRRYLQIVIKYTDETSKYFREVPAKTINAIVEKSQYGVLHLSGKTNSLEIIFWLEEGAVIELNNIEINKPVPYNFSIARLLIVFGIVLSFYLIFKLDIFEEVYNPKKFSHICTTTIVLFVFLIVSLIIHDLANKNKSIFSDLDVFPDNYVYEKEFTDALIDGKISLLVEPDPRLDTMENTYDMTARNEEGINYLFDFAYYKGKYYVYFTIIPQLLLNVPFKLITGKYLNITFEVLLFEILRISFCNDDRRTTGEKIFF